MKNLWNQVQSLFWYLWYRFWFWAFIIPAGIFYIIFYGFFGRRLKRKFQNNLKIAIGAKLKRDISLVLLPNHKALIETLLLPLLLWWAFLWYPSLVPVSTPDMHNFMEGEIFDMDPDLRWNRMRRWVGKISRWIGKKLMLLVPTIPVPRKSKLGSGRALFTMRDRLDRGKGIVLTFFAEGGRTFSAKDPANLRTENGRTIRYFERGIVDLVQRTEREFIIVPVWIDGADGFWPRGKKLPRPWRSLSFHFGRPFRNTMLSHWEPNAIKDYLERAVLNAKKN